MEICMDNHIRIIIKHRDITSSLYRVEQYKNRGYNGHNNVEDMITVIRIAFDF